MSDDYREMFDSEWTRAYDLNGSDRTAKILSVKGGVVTGEAGRKSKKPVVTLEGFEKPLALNKTNARAIAALYGPKTKAWIGKLVTLFPTTTEFGGQTVDCVRVRPQIPAAARPGAAPAAKAAVREPGEDDLS